MEPGIPQEGWEASNTSNQCRVIASVGLASNEVPMIAKSTQQEFNSRKETTMRIKSIDNAFLLSAIIVLIWLAGLGSPIAHAQAGEVKSLSRTDVAVSLYGAFSGTTTGNGVTQSPSNAAGGMFELRHIANPILGFEATYSFNRANQTYFSTLECPGTNCPQSTTTPVSANAHEVTGDWVPSVKVANLRPFAVLGIGLLLNVPTSGQVNSTVIVGCAPMQTVCAGPATTSTSTTTNVKPVYLYGAGLDWGLLPHIGLRFQYRGSLYHAPDVTKLYTSSGAFTHTAEPMIGAYLRF
jgi:opacity protein-like surface antigen